ncbi:autotransporter domain-containing protein [Candidatus Tisiphia endosymbiont of Nemotelus nigrinus]|uniref:autotransporter domain-containing protein n=1 Tax=Candidatus Tisiphia endosymbiont of Nemotelus nigrinus TaxID=3066263 RepID=UPI00312C826E
MNSKISMLFNIGLAQLVLISACKAESSSSPRAKLGESRLSPKVPTSSNTLSDRAIDSENIPLDTFSQNQSSNASYFGEDENRKPSLSTLKLPVVVQQAHKAKLPLQESNQLSPSSINNSSNQQTLNKDLYYHLYYKTKKQIPQLDQKITLENLLAKLENMQSIYTLSCQNSGATLAGSPTTIPTKPTTSTPTKISSNLVLSPTNNSQSDMFRDSCDPISPIKEIMSIPHKENNSYNIMGTLSRVFRKAFSPIFNIRTLWNTDSQLSGANSQGNEVQYLVSKLEGSSITDSPDLETSSSGAEPLILPTTSTTSNTIIHHRGQLKELKQKRKDNELTQAVKRQEQVNKKQRQRTQAEQNNRAIEQHPIVAQQLLAPATNKTPDVALAKNNIESSTVLDEGGWSKVENKAQRRARKVQEKLVVEQNHGAIEQQPIVSKLVIQQLLAPIINAPDTTFVQNNTRSSIVSVQGEQQEMVHKKRKKRNKRSIAEQAKLQEKLVVEQNHGAINQQPAAQPTDQQLLAPTTNKTPNVAFAQNNVEPNIVSDKEDWNEVFSRQQKRVNKNIAKQAKLQEKLVVESIAPVQGEQQDMVHKKREKRNKRNSAEQTKLQEKLVVEQNHGVINQQPAAQPTAQQLLTPATNKIPDVTFTQNNMESSIVSDEEGWIKAESKSQKRFRKDIAKQTKLQEKLVVESIVPVQGEQQEMVRKKRKKRNKRSIAEQEVQTHPKQAVQTQLEQEVQAQPEQSEQEVQAQPEQSEQVVQAQPKQSEQEVQAQLEQSEQEVQAQPKQSEQEVQAQPEQSEQVVQAQPKQSEQEVQAQPEQSEQVVQAQPKQSEQVVQAQPKQSVQSDSKSESSDLDSKSELPPSPTLKSNISDDNDITSCNNNDELILQEQVKALEQQTIEVQKQVTSATINSVASVFDFIEQSVQSRFHQLDLAVLASGDEDNVVSKNVWVSGTIGTSKYNGRKVLSRYTGRTSALTIGGDIELQGGSIIGGAYNYVLSNFKYKDRADKVAAHAHVISIYGQTNLSDKLILQGVLSLALGNVSAKIPVQNQLAKTKFANTSYSTKIVVAHKSQIGKILITPNIGLKYGGYNIAGYNESFETQSLSVAATNDKRASGIIGFETIIPMKISDTTQVIPGLHIECERFLHNKQQKLRMQIVSDSNRREEILLLEKPAKYNYKIGGTITLKRGMTEIMAVYDYLASSNKYSSHQGSLKLRVSF